MRDKETITIPLNKVSYKDLETLTIEQQTQLFVKDKEIERLNNIINELEKTLLEWHEYWEDDDSYSWEYKNIYDYLQELKGREKMEMIKYD